MDLWVGLEVQWDLEDLVDPWAVREALEDRWEDQWVDPEDQWEVLEDPEDRWVAQEDLWAAQVDL